MENGTDKFGTKPNKQRQTKPSIKLGIVGGIANFSNYTWAEVGISGRKGQMSYPKGVVEVADVKRAGKGHPHIKDYLTKFDPKSYEGVFLGYSQNSKAYIIFNKHTRKIKESLNVTFDETTPPSKTSPLVDDDLDEEESIKVTEKKILENDIEDETLEVDEIVNIKESMNHPLENIIGNLNQRTLRSQAQNQSNFFCFISTIEPKNVNEALTDERTKWVFRNKLDENDIVSRNKARLVAQGYNQQEGIDYDETYALVAILESNRILLAYACALDFNLFQIDFEMSMMDELNFFLELQIKQMEDDIFFNQSKYIKEMLRKFGLEDSKPMKTPMSSDTKLTKDEECESVDSTKHRGMIDKFGGGQHSHQKSPPSSQNASSSLPPRVNPQSPSPPSHNLLRDQMINQLHNIASILESQTQNSSNAYSHAPPLPPSPLIRPPTNAQVEFHSSFCHCCSLDRSMDSDKYLEGQSMQRPPLFESDSFIYWKNRFETYVKSKDLDLWHVITNGDFQPIQQNPQIPTAWSLLLLTVIDLSWMGWNISPWSRSLYCTRLAFFADAGL
ncbi:retrovirus-related pol polyprotein from transposon TNT 1-94 [Tanacetum coccineum]|uniref:Retrovirus-related pol polyprotein from transposon TNT 1-94 n=1 Tax=Tanacetum coccineum TaxID=301880 RepID=A0ABQ4YME3_9ASTR